MKAARPKALSLLFCLCLLGGSLSATASEETGGETRFAARNSSFKFHMAPGTEFTQEKADRIDLNSGQILVEANRPGRILTPLAEIEFKHKALVLLTVEPGFERCQLFWDNGADAVSISCNRSLFRLGPGKEVLISDHEPTSREVIGSDEIAHRRVLTRLIGSSRHVTTAEFSMLHALERCPMLTQVAQSEDPHDRDIKQRILKTVAVLNMVTSQHGYYTNGRRF